MHNQKLSYYSLRIERQICITKREEKSRSQRRMYSHSKVTIKEVHRKNELHMHIQMELKVLNCPNFDQIKPTEQTLTTDDKEPNLLLC